MMTRSRYNSLSIALAGLWIAGCSGETQPLDPETGEQLRTITAAEVRQEVEQTIASHASGLERTLSGMAGSPLGQAFGIVASDPAEADRRAQELSEEIATRLFAPDSVESATDIQVTYRVRSERVCGDTPQSLDADCVRLFDQVPVRLLVTSGVSGAIAVQVEIGQSRHRALRFRLAADRIMSEMDLAASKAAFDEIAAVLQLDTDGLPTSAVGRFSVTLSRFAQRDFAFDLRILDAITIASATPSYLFRVAAQALPVASLRIDASAMVAGLFLNLGEIDAAAPGELLGELFEAEDLALLGQIAVHLAGATASATIDGTEDELTVMGVGLGNAQSTIAADGVRVFGFDVNPSAGRRFDITLTPDTTGGVEISVAPSLELIASIDFGLLLDRGLDLPGWTRAEVLRLALDGAAAPALAFPSDDGGVIARIARGNLRLSADTRADVLTATPGQCVSADDTATDDAHPLDVLQAAACPAP